MKRTLWTDGCSNKAGSGWAVICPDRRIIHRGDLRDAQGQSTTNQKAELSAIVQAVHLYGHDIKIISDSDYGIKCFTQWYPNWLQNGWRASTGGPVVNRPLIELGLQKQAHLAEYEHVGRNDGDPYNIMADYYAKHAVLQPIHLQQGWVLLT